MPFDRIMQIAQYLMHDKRLSIKEIDVSRDRQRVFENGYWMVVAMGESEAAVWVKEGGEVCLMGFAGLMEHVFGGKQWETVGMWRLTKPTG